MATGGDNQTRVSVDHTTYIRIDYILDCEARQSVQLAIYNTDLYQL